MPRVSVVMPMYNVEHYLFEALQSLRMQTLTDFEVIVVDDGSTDDSPAIADRFCDDDARFRLVHQTNRGPGPGGGRNGGLAYAGGDLLMFVDSDDLLLPNTLADMAALLEDPKLDMATTSAARLAGATRRQSIIHDMSHRVAEASTTATRSPWLMFDSTPWNKLFRREFFDSVVGTWSEQQLYEDIAPMTACHLRSRATGVLAEPQYLWRTRSDGTSITQQRRGIDGDLAQIEQLLIADSLVREIGTGDTKDWLDWKAYTYDFVWMMRKLVLLDRASAGRLVEAVATAMERIGTTVVQHLGPELRQSVDAILARDTRRSRRLSVTNRMALLPDRRGLDRARSQAVLTAILVSATRTSVGERLVVSSPAHAGRPWLELGNRGPWSPPETTSLLTPSSSSRRGTQRRSTFDVTIGDLPTAAAGAPAFATLHTPGASGELRRSIGDRVRRRTGDHTIVGDVRHFFEDGKAVFVGPPGPPYVTSVRCDGTTVTFAGRLADAVAADRATVTDAGGAHRLTYPVVFGTEPTSTFDFDVPLAHVRPGIDYFLAFTTSNNPGLPIEICVATETLLDNGAEAAVTLLPSVGGQASFRCKGNVFKASYTEMRRRVRR